MTSRLWAAFLMGQTMKPEMASPAIHVPPAFMPMSCGGCGATAATAARAAMVAEFEA